MAGSLIDGKTIAQTIRDELKEEVIQLQSEFGRVPGLAVVIVGERKDSQTYVRMKRRACAEAGILSIDHDLPEDTPHDELLRIVRELNDNPEVHGILIQVI